MGFIFHYTASSFEQFPEEIFQLVCLKFYKIIRTEFQMGIKKLQSKRHIASQRVVRIDMFFNWIYSLIFSYQTSCYIHFWRQTTSNFYFLKGYNQNFGLKFSSLRPNENSFFASKVFPSSFIAWTTFFYSLFNLQRSKYIFSFYTQNSLIKFSRPHSMFMFVSAKKHQLFVTPLCSPLSSAITFRSTQIFRPWSS